MTPDWTSIIGSNLAVAGGLCWSFKLGLYSCPCDQLPDPDAWLPGCEWTANPDARPRPGPPCSCSDDGGNSRCARHPTCSGCGCGVERGEEVCDGCKTQCEWCDGTGIVGRGTEQGGTCDGCIGTGRSDLGAPIIVSGLVGRCSRCRGWLWFQRGVTDPAGNAWAEEAARDGDAFAIENGDIGQMCAYASQAPLERTCTPSSSESTP